MAKKSMSKPGFETVISKPNQVSTMYTASDKSGAPLQGMAQKRQSVDGKGMAKIERYRPVDGR